MRAFGEWLVVLAAGLVVADGNFVWARAEIVQQEVVTGEAVSDGTCVLRGKGDEMRGRNNS